MLRINRLKVLIDTESETFGFDECFTKGLNFIASGQNTSGKSSIIAAIYYALGFEEIIGGKGEKVLTAAYKNSIEHDNISLEVLTSEVFLEVSNGGEIITINRAAKDSERDSKLVTVYYSSLQDIDSAETIKEDMYVHMQNSAVSRKGFHKYLESFLHLELPHVAASNDDTRKLYLQLVFSAMFIEQKHGWGDILSGLPILGIKEAKKRVLEFILNLDTLESEKKKEDIKMKEIEINKRWNKIVQENSIYAQKELFDVNNLPLNPTVLDEEALSLITLIKNSTDIEEFLSDLKEQYEKLIERKPKIFDNFDEIEKELKITEETINTFKNELRNQNEMLYFENDSIKNLESNLEILEADIRNNKDAARLRDLGSSLHLNLSKDTCPVCGQHIQDTLLLSKSDVPVMSVDENIRHLEAQKNMLEFAYQSHIRNKANLVNRVAQIEEGLSKLLRLAKSLRNDLYSTDDALSESQLYKRLQIQNEISNVEKLLKFWNFQKDELLELSIQWSNYLDEKKLLPNKKFTQLDERKLATLRKNFIANIKTFGYKSILDLEQVSISTESFLPLIEGFDMKFDSSASDNIRAIWAFVIALLQTSNQLGGNHPGILIFDEPAQHSIVTNDMLEFFKKIISMSTSCQVIIGITIKDTEIKQAIEQLKASDYNFIQVPYKAFQKIH